jgi:hypothetical protein
MTRPSFSRVACGLVAAVSLSICSAAMAQVPMKKATETIIIPYTLGPGAKSGFITVPPNIPVMVTGNQTVIGDIGVGQVVMHNVPGDALQWIGGSSHSGPVSGFGKGGDLIMTLDFRGFVELIVKPGSEASGFGFIIENTSGSGTYTGEVRITE